MANEFSESFVKSIERSTKKQFPQDLGPSMSMGISSAEKPYALITFNKFEAEIWLEYDKDIRVQLVPIQRRFKFENAHMLAIQADKVFGNILHTSGAKVVANMYGPGYTTGNLARNSDIKQRGMQMLEMNFLELNLRPHAGDMVVAGLKQLDEILSGISPAR